MEEEATFYFQLSATGNLPQDAGRWQDGNGKH